TAVRQAAIMTDDETKKVTFKFAKNKLTLQAQGAATGRSKVELEITHEAKPIDISFNPSYLLEMLKVLPPEAELTLDLIDEKSPAVFRSGPHYTYFVTTMS